MTDTQRTKADLLDNLFQDGQVAGISAQDMRDLIVSMAPDYAGLYFTTPAVTTITTAGTHVKAAGTTTQTSATATMNTATDNRLVYNGATMRHFHIVLQVSVQMVSGTNQDVGIQLYKYTEATETGALLAHSEARTTLGGTAVEQITSHADAHMAAGDYIEIHIANHSSTNNTEVKFGYMFCVSMIM